MTQEMYDRAIKYGGEEQAAFLYQLPELWRQNGFVLIDPDFLAVFTRQLHAAGVPLVVGTGAHSALTVAGKSTVDEM